MTVQKYTDLHISKCTAWSWLFTAET